MPDCSTEAVDQTIVCPSTRREVSVFAEIAFGRPSYIFSVVPPQPNFPSRAVPDTDRASHRRERTRDGADASIPRSIAAAAPTPESATRDRDSSGRSG